MNLEVSSWTKYFGTGNQEVREHRSQEFGTRLQEVRSGTNQKRGSHFIDYEVKTSDQKVIKRRQELRKGVHEERPSSGKSEPGAKN
jgi:hypothetical protein